MNDRGVVSGSGRAIFCAAIAAMPLVWLVGRGLITPNTLPGGADIYVRLTTLAALLGPGWAVRFTRLEMVAGALATLIVTWLWSRRILDEFGAGVATACFAAGPSVVGALARGDADALDGWALVLLPLCTGRVALMAGALIGWFAPSLAMASGVGVLAVGGFRGSFRMVVGRRTWPLAGWGVACAVAALTHRAAFIGVEEPLVAGLAVHRLTWLAPLLLAAIVFRRFPRPDAAMFGGALLLALGWRYGGTKLPIESVDLSVPETIAHVVSGTVLDLPTTRTANRRAGWLGAFHHQPRAANADGFLPVAAQSAADELLAGHCPDLAALGIAQVLARREEATHDLSAVVTCLGTPVSDDGRVALWVVGGPPR